MSQLLVPSLKISRCEIIQRKRELPLAGEIIAKIGAKVSPESVIARAVLPGELLIVRVAEKMMISPAEAARGARVKVGDLVEVGQLLSEVSGLFSIFKSRFRSPYAGTIEFISDETGHFGIRLAERFIDLKAYIGGEVVAIEESRAVTIRSQAAFLQGIFGVGGEKVGVLSLLDISPSEIIDEGVARAAAKKNVVLVGGAGVTQDALKVCGEKGVAGIVTGGVIDQVLKGFLGYDLGLALTGEEKVPFTLIITEGFGKLPMNHRIVELCREHDGKEVSINGTTQVRAGAVRPEMIISNVVAQVNDQNTDLELKTGARIRLIREPFFGKFAFVSELPAEPQKISTGAMVRVLKARLDSGEEVLVPRANVELV
ncbi:MAG TPA: hypothetical protein PKD37_04545 [Oligoflexia bacterium]|nr:hypothetical protein [Oligoflexia bacterium]HMP27233.1 hypothetical protein [Oligoflexia bacterium]